MTRRSREEYVRDKIVYHLARFSPAVRAAVLLKVARELAVLDAARRTFDASVQIRVRPQAREAARGIPVPRRRIASGKP